MFKVKGRFVALLLAVLMVMSSFSVIAATAQVDDNDYRPRQHTEITEVTLVSHETSYVNEQNFYELPAPLGIIGFEDGFDSNPSALIEIGVQFRTPPSVALRLMQETNPRARNLSASHESYAIAAHTAFFTQLSQLGERERGAFGAFSSQSFDVISEHHELFNGVFLRVPAYMVEVIAELPEVYAVMPNAEVVFVGDIGNGDDIIYENQEEIEYEDADYNDDTYEEVEYEYDDLGYENDDHEDYEDFEIPSTSFEPFGIAPGDNFMRQTRELFDVYYIHNTLGITGSGVRVAVIDSGIDYNHPRFVPFQDPITGRVRGRNFAENLNSPMDVPGADGFGHGTSVAGPVIAMAPGIELWAYRTSHISSVISAVENARSVANADVINISLGPPPSWDGPFNAIKGALNLAARDGIVVVAAAANRGPNPFSTDIRGGLVLTVANGELGSDIPSTHNRGGVFAESSRGPEPITFLIGPDITAPGTLVRTTDFGGGYTLATGTSFSAPTIAGIAALLIQAFPSASSCEIIARIMNTAGQLDYQANPSVRYENSVFSIGAGFVNPIQALTGSAYATVNNVIEWGGLGFAGWPTDYIAFSTPALNFGAVFGNVSQPLTVTIHNPGSGIWVPEVRFNNHVRSHDGVGLSLVSSGSDGQGLTFTYQMTFAGNVSRGMYEGNVVFTNAMQPGRVISVPFGAYYDFERVLTIRPNIDHVFPSRQEGYTSAEQLRINAENRSIVHSGQRYIFISGPNADSFEHSLYPVNFILSVNPRSGNMTTSAIFTIRPRLGLPVGTHTAIVTIVNRQMMPNDAPTSFNISFEVTEAPVVRADSWEELRAEVNASEPGVETRIYIGSSFAATNTAITIPANRHITLVSSNTAEGSANIRTLTQENRNQRHFIINATGSLTLCRNITLRGSRDTMSGGVQVNGGGKLVMNTGSIIENAWDAAVVLNGSGTEESTQARFTMNGGIIQHNIGRHVGGVDVGTNSIFIMNDGSEIKYNISNQPVNTSQSAGGVLLHARTSIFEMRGTATIRNNIVYRTVRYTAGGVLVSDNGTFTMYGGNIINNEDSTNGIGGVLIRSGTFTMHDGRISDNIGRGVQLRYGTFTMNDGEICRNTFIGVELTHGTMTMSNGIISENCDMGVRISSNFVPAIFTMANGMISDNRSTGVSIRNTVFTMLGGEIRGNISEGQFGAGVQVNLDGEFTMEGGVITENTQNGGTTANAGGGGVRVTGGTFNMTSSNAIIKNNNSLGTAITAGGGGIHQANGIVNITAGEITGNTALRGGGVYVSATAVSAFTITGGSITSNTATQNGGGIYSTQANHSHIIPATAYQNLNIGPDVIFTNNTAGNGPSALPNNRLPHIATTQSTIWGYALNNHDINYTGRLGLGNEHGISTWVQLRAAINAAPYNTPTTLYILNSFETPWNTTAGDTILIPAGHHITLVSSNQNGDEANVRVITQTRSNPHFIVSAGSSLTLCRNIVLSRNLDNFVNAGGISVSGGGELIMNPGSVIENVRGSNSVSLNGSGTDEASRARLTMNGGTIRNGQSFNVGGVLVGANSIFIMNDGSMLYGNRTLNAARTTAAAGGVLVSTPTSVFEMRGSATIKDNESTPTNLLVTENPGHAGGVLVVDGIFTMYGGYIVNNRTVSPRGGGGVRVSDGLFTMHDGYITGNISPGGGVRLDRFGGAHFIMNGGTINNNDDSGVQIWFGTMTMNGGVIRDNNQGVRIGAATSVFNMNGGEIRDNTSTQTLGAGVHIHSGTFTMAGGRIYNNINDGLWRANSGGGGVRIANGTFNMISNDAVIENNHAIEAHWAVGGGIRHDGGTVNITAGRIIGNTALRGGGVHVSAVAVGAFTMTGGSIANNSAAQYGGGIYSTQAIHSQIVPETAYLNLNIGPAVVFVSNTAGNGPSAPPDNRLPHIATTSASRWGHPLNNYDINYTGRLNQEHGIGTWAQLRAAINAAPPNTPTTIYLLNSFDAPTGAEANAITIPADRQIILVSSNPTPGPANVRMVAQHNSNQRHFIVSGHLTLGRNVTLSLGNNSGGVQVAGGTFVMADGSDILAG